LLCVFSSSSSYGPRASSKLLSSATPFSGERGHFAVDAKYAPFASSGARRARRGAQLEADERALQTQLAECLSVSIHLESFPKAVLEAFVIVLQDEGSVFASAVAATSLAFADAGIMLYDLTTACRAITLDGQLLLDPSAEEEARWAAAVADAADAANDGEDGDAAAEAAAAATSVTLAYMPSLRQISSITQSGSSGSTAQLVTSLTHLAIAGCEQLNGLMRECLVDSAKQQMTLNVNGAAASTTAARPPA
jgi:exosome complex component MTR3